MERVTHIDKDGWYINGANVATVFHSGTGEIRMRGKDIDRLAAYEDTGLEPEKIEQLKGEVFGLKVDKQELEQAKRERRIIPKGYALVKLKLLEELDNFRELGPIDRLRELAQADSKGLFVVLPCKRDDVLWTFHTYPSKRVYSFHVTDLSTLNGRTMLNTDIMGVVDSRDVGKTVFLTRKEAEAALRREQDG